MITLDLSILNQKGTPMFYSDTLALRPNFGIAGRIFIDIASPYGIYRDTGSAWVQIASVGGGGIGGSGTATQIAYFTGSSTIASSANLFWDNTNARLGVNTATPGSSLDVHSSVQSVIQANNTTLGNSFLSFQLQGTGKWQIGNVYNANANYFRIQDQLNSLERFTIFNTGKIDFYGWQQTTNTITGINGTTPSALPNSGFANNFTFNSGISSSASVNTIGVLVDNVLNYSGANTINATSYNASGLFRIGLTFGSAAASITYTQGATAQIRALTSNQVQYIQNGNNSGTISHYANIQILGDNKSGSGLTTFTNRYGLLINDFNDFGVGNTYTNRWGIYQQGLNENNFFAGKVGIGSGYTPSTLQLDVTGKARVTDQLSVDLISSFLPTFKSGGIFLQSASAINNNICLNTYYDGTSFKAISTGFTGYLQSFLGSITLNGSNASVSAGSAGTTITYFNFNPTESKLFANIFNSNNSTYVDFVIGNSYDNTKFIKYSYLTGGYSHYLVSRHDSVLNSVQNQLTLYINNSTTVGGSSAPTVGNVLSNSQSAISSAFFLPTLFKVGGAVTDVPVACAAIEIVSTTKGLLFPKMTTAQKNAIVSPVAGLIVYDTTLNKLCVYTTAWETVTSI